jgi:phage terminase small subunit
MTAQRARFVELLVVEGKSGTDAAIGAGYSAQSAASMAYQLIHNPIVAEAIKQRRESLSMRSLATRDRWEEEVCRLAFFDPGQLFEDDGSLKRIKDMPEDARRVLAGLEVVELFDGQGDQKHAIGLVKKARLPNKKEALELLAKANGWVVDRKELTGKDGAPLVPAEALDLSKLSVEELRVLLSLTAKAKAADAPTD